MSYPLRQSTASQYVTFGYAVDSTDGNTEETALTIANTDIKIHKRGATTLANKNSGGATHISNGIYYATFDATDTDTAGPIDIYIHVSGALYLVKTCIVYPATIFDAMFLGTDNLDVNVVQWLGTACATPTTAGVPEVDLTHISGSAVSTSTAQLGVNVVQAGATAWNSGAITYNTFGSSAALARGAVATGAVDSGTTTTMVDSARSEADDDYWVGSWITFTSGNASGQTRYITGFTASSDTVTFAPALTQACASTDTYFITPGVDYLRPTVSSRTLDVSATGEAGVDWANVGSPTTTVDLSGTTIATTQEITLNAAAIDAIWDEVFEGSTTVRQAIRGFASALLAKLSGAATTTVVARDIGDSKDRITATVDADGNRTAVTLDLT